jgi:O6-methylguanine-DNA--protein-cysteine methyltransferase
MKLAEMIKLFEQFGFHEAHVRAALARGDSVSNAFEGLKATLMIRWDEMNQTESVDKLKELRSTYDRIMGMKLKSATKESDVAKERARQVVSAAEDMGQKVKRQKAVNTALVMDELRKQLEKQLEKTPECQRTRDALEKIERGESPF